MPARLDAGGTDRAPHSRWVAEICARRHAPVERLPISPYSSAVREVKQIVLRAGVRSRRAPAPSEHRGDTRGVVERRVEPAVVMRADDERRRRSLALEVADDVAAGGAARELDVERQPTSNGARERGPQARDVLAAQGDHGGAPACQCESNEPSTPSDW